MSLPATAPLPGTHSARTLAFDAAGNPLTSTSISATTQALDVNVAQSVAVSVNGKSIKTVTGSVSANTSIVSLVANKRIKIIAFSVLTAYSAAAINPIFTNGNGGTTLWSILLQAISGAVSGANLAVCSPSFLFATSAGTALYFNPNGQTCYYSLSYFDDDAT